MEPCFLGRCQLAFHIYKEYQFVRGDKPGLDNNTLDLRETARTPR